MSSDGSLYDSGKKFRMHFKKKGHTEGALICLEKPFKAC